MSDLFSPLTEDRTGNQHLSSIMSSNLASSNPTSSDNTSSNTPSSDIMSSNISIIALPYEVRAQIFQDYFTVDGGYIYHGESEKLVRADGQPIDFSLLYTCRSIADDTRHMPLSLNTITFSTVYRQDWRQQAGGIEAIVALHRQIQERMVSQLATRVTPDIYSQLADKFPQNVQGVKDFVSSVSEAWGLQSSHAGLFSSYLDSGLDDPNTYRGILWHTLGAGLGLHFYGGRSSFFSAIDYTLRLLAEKYPIEFASLVDKTLPDWGHSHALHEFMNLTFDPWAIPSLSEVLAVGNQLEANGFWDCLEEWYYNSSHKGTGDRYREKLYFSAAAVAIRFLHRLPKHHRLRIRNITLNEDRVAVANPEFHARGLIPFCKENSKLRVERRVNLWRNILLKSNRPSIKDIWRLAEGGPYPPWDFPCSAESDIGSYTVDSELLPWLADALEIMDEGMPAGSFSFVLDGEPDLDLSSDLFDRVIHRQVAWKKSLTECVARGLFPHPNALTFEGQLDKQFWLPPDHLPEAIDKLMSGTSILQSNFNLGQPWDYESLIPEHLEQDDLEWMSKVESVEPRLFPFPTLVKPLKLRLEMFEKQRQCEYLDSSLNISKREKKRLRRVRRRRVATLTAENATRNTSSDLKLDSDSDMMEEKMRLLFGDVS
ncbi:hypothetical protein EDB81DRAFT_797712 [Dactylonectria macrodidyma]|uniref:Uncharacterized protein n=1 Tax=Dactylonectria macrodidyma TaxID=307937 RepID=A0A9P9J1H1_9HYPO|nr:hypothetical protein EDB81DRAFT_797712 [Dactylonectria macrodidyma]